jgi:hypothetical protein
MAPRARPPNRVERPNGQPGRSTPKPSPKRITPTLADTGDHVSTETAEQLAYDWHLADDRDYPPGLEHCACSCPWCTP